MDVSSLFKSVSADTKGQAVAPTEGGSEWNQWIEWLNEELQVFGEIHDWIEYKNLSYLATAEQSGTSVALPSNLKKLAGSPVINGYFYNEVDPDQFDKYASTQKKCRIGYDNGNYLEFKGALTAGASVVVPIQCYPSALATGSDQITFRNPMYLVKRLKVRVFKYRQDPIFTELETEADTMLKQIVENEYYKHSQYEYGATTQEEEQGFVLGID